MTVAPEPNRPTVVADGLVDLIATVHRFDGRQETGRLYSHSYGLTFLGSQSGAHDLGAWGWLAQFDFAWADTDTTRLTVWSYGGAVGTFEVRATFAQTDSVALRLAASGRVRVVLEGDVISDEDARKELAEPADSAGPEASEISE